MVFSMRSRTSPSSSSDACRVLSRSAASRASAALTAGIFPSDAASASTSRGFAVSSVTRLSNLFQIEHAIERSPQFLPRDGFFHAGFHRIEPAHESRSNPATAAAATRAAAVCPWA